MIQRYLAANNFPAAFTTLRAMLLEAKKLSGTNTVEVWMRQWEAIGVRDDGQIVGDRVLPIVPIKRPSTKTGILINMLGSGAVGHSFGNFIVALIGAESKFLHESTGDNEEAWLKRLVYLANASDAAQLDLNIIHKLLRRSQAKKYKSLTWALGVFLQRHVVDSESEGAIKQR